MAMKSGVKALFHPQRFKSPVPQNMYELKRLDNLPLAYQKFYKEWRAETKPVHWVPRVEKWERNPETGETKPVQNCPIPVTYPHQVHQGIWGGEGVVYGLVKKAKYRSPVPRFWVPKLKETVLYSEILDKYLEVVVTERALRLIDESYGLDNYLLQTPASDIRSLVALKIKRRILLALADKDFAHNNPNKQQELLEKYQQFIIPREEADWIGLSFQEAWAKVDKIQKEAKLAAIQPLKHQYRLDLIRSLEAKKSGEFTDDHESNSKTSAWLSKLNPFAKPAGAS